MSLKNSGQIFVVALPIGNPKDISFRVIEVLESVNYVACEDTRTFGLLAQQLGIKYGKLISYHDHNENIRSTEIIEFLKNGFTVALVSDAGTPGIHDPGYHILKLAYEKEIAVQVIPGPSSLTAALSISPIGGNSHLFLGFLSPKSKARMDAFEKSILSTAHQIVCFEAPHRILEHLKDALVVFEDIEVFICRELTKKYEEKFYGKLSLAIQHFSQHEPKGEFVIIYKNPNVKGLSLEVISEQIVELLSKGLSTKDIQTMLEKHSTLTHKELYNLILKHKN